MGEKNQVHQSERQTPALGHLRSCSPLGQVGDDGVGGGREKRRSINKVDNPREKAWFTVHMGLETEASHMPLCLGAGEQRWLHCTVGQPGAAP